jgi:predicted transcriptional regulator
MSKSVINMLSPPEPKNEILDVVTPAAKKIFLILQTEERMYVSEIRERTTYCRRTIQFALSQLVAAELITPAPDLRDMRKTYYMISSA